MANPDVKRTYPDIPTARRTLTYEQQRNFAGNYFRQHNMNNDDVFMNDVVQTAKNLYKAENVEGLYDYLNDRDKTAWNERAIVYILGMTAQTCNDDEYQAVMTNDPNYFVERPGSLPDDARWVERQRAVDADEQRRYLAAEYDIGEQSTPLWQRKKITPQRRAQEQRHAIEYDVPATAQARVYAEPRNGGSLLSNLRDAVFSGKKGSNSPEGANVKRQKRPVKIEEIEYDEEGLGNVFSSYQGLVAVLLLQFVVAGVDWFTNVDFLAGDWQTATGLQHALALFFMLSEVWLQIVNSFDERRANKRKPSWKMFVAKLVCWSFIGLDMLASAIPIIESGSPMSDLPSRLSQYPLEVISLVVAGGGFAYLSWVMQTEFVRQLAVFVELTKQRIRG